MPSYRGHRPKVKIGISLDPEVYEWLAARTGPGGEFASISHAIERCVVQYQRKLERSSHPHDATGSAHT